MIFVMFICQILFRAVLVTQARYGALPLHALFFLLQEFDCIALRPIAGESKFVIFCPACQLAARRSRITLKLKDISSTSHFYAK